jgi:hypothetical protein
MTKLGKLLYIMKGVGTGALVGSTQPTLGQGFMAAQQQSDQQRQIQNAQQQSQIGLEQARQNLQYLPLMRAMQLQAQQSKIGLQKAQADRAEAAANRWGTPKQVGDRMMAYNPDTQKLEDVGAAGKPIVKQFGDRMVQFDPSETDPSKQWKDVGDAPVKGTTPWGKIAPDIYGQLGDMPTSSTFKGKDYGTIDEARAEWGRRAQQIEDQKAQAKAAGYARTRGQVVTDTDTGITAPVPWDILGSAPPGKYISPQYDPNTRLTVKAWQDLAPSGTVGKQVTSYDTYLRHAGALYDAVEGLKNSGYPDWNKPMNYLRTHSGDPRVQVFLSKMDPVQKEFQSFLLGGHALYAEDRDTAKGMMSENSSPQTMYGVLQSMIHTGNARLGAINDTFHRATGQDIPELISPEGQSAIQKVGGAQAVKEMPPIVPRAPRGKTAATPPTPSTHVFNAKAWAAANPGKDVNAAIAQAKQQGFQILQ